jgi:hypothetical protein
MIEAWLTWLQTAKEQRRIDKVGAKVVAWWQGGVLASSLFTWRFHASEQLRLQFVVQRVIDRMTHRALWSSFQAWLVQIEDELNQTREYRVASRDKSSGRKVSTFLSKSSGEADLICRDRVSDLKALQRFVHGLYAK